MIHLNTANMVEHATFHLCGQMMHPKVIHPNTPNMIQTQQ